MHQKGTSFVGQALHPHLTSMLRGVSGTVLRHACRVEGPGALGAVPGLRWIQRNPSGCEDVPMGHKDSDLNAHTCNASLLRRKELHHLSHLDLLVDGRPTPIREVLQVGPRGRDAWSRGSANGMPVLGSTARSESGQEERGLQAVSWTSTRQAAAWLTEHTRRALISVGLPALRHCCLQ